MRTGPWGCRRSAASRGVTLGPAGLHDISEEDGPLSVRGPGTQIQPQPLEPCATPASGGSPDRTGSWTALLWWSLSQAAGRESRPSSDRLLAAGGLLTGLGAPDPEPAAAQPPASSQDSDVRVYLSPFQNSLLSSVPLKEPPRTQPHLPGCVGTPPLGPGSSLGLGASYPSRWCLSPCHVCFCFLL